MKRVTKKQLKKQSSPKNLEMDKVAVHYPNGKVEIQPIKAVGLPQEPIIENEDYDNGDPATVMEDMLLQDNIYKIEDIDKTPDNINHPKCPIIYDGDHIICSPVPHDVVLESIHDQIYGEDYDSESDLFQLRVQAMNVLSSMYTNAAIATCESFLGKNLFDFLTYTKASGVIGFINMDKMITDICLRSNIDNYMTRMFYKWWETMDDKNMSIEEKNMANSNYLSITRNSILNSLADNMSRFAREIAFGEHTYAYAEINPQEMNEFFNDTANRYQDDNPRQTIYLALTIGLTGMLDALSPMIDILLWQSVNSFNYVYFEAPDYTPFC